MAVKVTLLNYTPNPEQTVAMAAKLCYSPSGIEDIRDGLTEEKTAAFIDMLSDLGHASPIEHASFTRNRGYFARLFTPACSAPHCFLQPAVTALCRRHKV